MRKPFKQFVIFLFIAFAFLFSTCRYPIQDTAGSKGFCLDDKTIKSFYKIHKKDLIIPPSVEYECLDIFYDNNKKNSDEIKTIIHDFKGNLLDLSKKLKELDISCYLSKKVFYYFEKQKDKDIIFGETLNKTPMCVPTIVSSPFDEDEYFSNKIMVISIIKKTERKELPFIELKDRIYAILATYSEEDAKIWDNNRPEGASTFDKIKGQGIDKELQSRMEKIEKNIEDADNDADLEQVAMLGDQILEADWKLGNDWTYFRMGYAYYETQQYKRAVVAYHWGSTEHWCGNCAMEREQTKYKGLAKAYNVIGDIPACIKYSILWGSADRYYKDSFMEPYRFIKKYKVDLKRIMEGGKIVVSNPDFNFPSEWLIEYYIKEIFSCYNIDNELPNAGRKTSKSEDAVLSGLIWLAKHQNPDGSWGAKTFQNQCRDIKCSGIGDEQFNIGLTGLSILAFTGAGYTNSSRDTYEGICFGDVVRKGAFYLTGIQLSDGTFGGIKEGKFMYNQALATYALADLYALTMDIPGGIIFREPMERAVKYIVDARNPGKAWRYQPKSGQNDTSVTGWITMALKAAEGCNIPIPPEAFADIKLFYDDVTDKTYGRVGYTELGSVAIRGDEDLRLVNPNTIQPALTAIGIMVRILIDKKTTDPLIKLGVSQILSRLPTWDTSNPCIIDYYYWFYASYCLNQYDGPNGPSWSAWNEKMKEVLLKSQHTKADGCANGSWDAIGRWSSEAGRVYCTATNVLTLELYYRLGIVRLK